MVRKKQYVSWILLTLAPSLCLVSNPSWTTVVDVVMNDFADRIPVNHRLVSVMTVTWFNSSKVLEVTHSFNLVPRVSGERVFVKGTALKSQFISTVKYWQLPEITKCKWEKAKLIKQWKEDILFHPIFRKALPFSYEQRRCLSKYWIKLWILLPLFYQPFSYFHLKNYSWSYPSRGSGASFC